MTWLAAGACLRMTARFYNDTGNVVVPALAASSGNDDAMVLPAADRSEITAHLDIPSCQYKCPRELGRASTLFPIAPSRKARVVGLACTRICPRLSSPSRKPGNEQNSLEIRSYFGRLDVVICAGIVDDMSDKHRRF